MESELTQHPDAVPAPAEGVAPPDTPAPPAAQPPAVPRSPNQDDPEGWSASWRAWVASRPKKPTTMDDSRESIYEGCGE